MLVLVDNYVDVLLSRQLDELDLEMLGEVKGAHSLYLNTLLPESNEAWLQQAATIRKLVGYGYITNTDSCLKLTPEGESALQYNDMIGYVSAVHTKATFGLVSTELADTTIDVMGFSGKPIGSFSFPSDCRITPSTLNGIVPDGVVALSRDHKALLNYIHQWND